jgi:hypothetical protein
MFARIRPNRLAGSQKAGLAVPIASATSTRTSAIAASGGAAGRRSCDAPEAGGDRLVAQRLAGELVH